MRRFAHARPRAYALVIGRAPELPRPTPEAMGVSLRFLLAATTALAGEEHALDAARLVVAWANGFITMELADALQMGGDIDAAWTWGLERIVAAIAGGDPRADRCAGPHRAHSHRRSCARSCLRCSARRANRSASRG